MGDLGSGKERGGGIGAGGDAGTAPDAGGGVHGAVGDFFADEMSVAVGGIAGGDGDIATGSDDAVEGAAVDDKIFDGREGSRPPGLDDQLFSFLEVAHGQLADGGGGPGTVGNAIDH